MKRSTRFPSAVADTNALLFHAAGGQRLGPRARRHLGAAELGQAIVYVPMAVVWEICVLARSGRINMRRSVRAFCSDLFSNPAYQPYDLTADQAYRAEDLRFTRDPFDVLIVAAAQSLDLPLVTRDHEIRESGTVRVIW